MLALFFASSALAIAENNAQNPLVTLNEGLGRRRWGYDEWRWARSGDSDSGWEASGSTSGDGSSEEVSASTEEEQKKQLVAFEATCDKLKKVESEDSSAIESDENEEAAETLEACEKYWKEKKKAGPKADAEIANAKVEVAEDAAEKIKDADSGELAEKKEKCKKVDKIRRTIAELGLGREVKEWAADNQLYRRGVDAGEGEIRDAPISAGEGEIRDARFWGFIGNIVKSVGPKLIEGASSALSSMGRRRRRGEMKRRLSDPLDLRRRGPGYRALERLARSGDLSPEEVEDCLFIEEAEKNDSDVADVVEEAEENASGSPSGSSSEDESEDSIVREIVDEARSLVERFYRAERALSSRY